MAASDHKGYYKLLDLQPGATVDQVKKAYKASQSKLHPSGPERRKMRESDAYKKLSDEEKEKKEKDLDEKAAEINTAYTVLSDKNKKEEYDSGRGDYNGADPTAGFGGGFEDIFGSMFNQGHRSKPREAKVADTVSTIKVTMQQAYTGKVSKFKIQTTRVCGPCKGKGYPKSKTCHQCGGQGRVYLQRSMGMMITRQEIDCNVCNASGVIGSGPACTTCKGEKVTRTAFVVEVSVRAGAKDGEQYVYAGQGNHTPGKRPGDLIFVVSVEKDPNFKRVGDDLVAKTSVYLHTILSGGYAHFTHLDGRKMAIKVGPVQKISNFICLHNEGFKAKDGRKGHLYLDMEILVGTPKIDINVLNNLLPAQPNTDKGGKFTNCNATYVQTLPTEQPKAHSYRNQEEYEGDDSEGFDPRSFFKGGFSSFF